MANCKEKLESGIHCLLVFFKLRIRFLRNEGMNPGSAILPDLCCFCCLFIKLLRNNYNIIPRVKVYVKFVA